MNTSIWLYIVDLVSKQNVHYIMLKCERKKYLQKKLPMKLLKHFASILIRRISVPKLSVGLKTNRKTSFMTHSVIPSICQIIFAMTPDSTSQQSFKLAL